MKKANKYYFEIFLEFEEDYDVESIEEKIGYKPHRLLTRSMHAKKVEKAVVYEADGSTHKITPKAMFSYRTEEKTELFIDDEFAKFVMEADIKLKNYIQEIKDNKGQITFKIVFTEFKDKPYFSFSREIIKILAKCDAEIMVDYV
ncbi:MAG: hypothetical protein IJX17_04380 [Clostridia bacterium]|nr:hypothetical protein [Clostridia bacterium]